MTLPSVDNLLSCMTLKEKIAQLFFHEFIGLTDLSEDLKALNRQNLLGNLILFSGINLYDIEQLRQLTQRIQEQRFENDYQLPFFIALDQEGGQLTALFRGTTLFPGNMCLGLANDPKLTYKQGLHCGQELSYAGINLCLAPVLDGAYDHPDGKPVVDNRMYGNTPEQVATHGVAYVKGLQASGLMACGKHYPGMRPAEVDTHFKLDIIRKDKARLTEMELLPFQHAIDHGIDALMTHHGIYPTFDAEHPATLSPAAIQHLRRQMGFNGLIITDDLVMGAIVNNYGHDDAMIRALNAGVDLIISTHRRRDFADFIERSVRSGRVPEAHIDAAARRILTIKCRPQFGQHPPKPTFNSKTGQALAYTIASQGLRLYQDRGQQLPLRLDPKRPLGIIYANQARLTTSDVTNLYPPFSLQSVIEKKGYHPCIRQMTMPWSPTDEEKYSLGDLTMISQALIITTVNAYYFTRQLDTLAFIRHIAGPEKLIIAVATRSPDDVHLLKPYADVVIATGGLTPVNLETLVDALFGRLTVIPAGNSRWS